jgi:hypothetical protein
MPLSAVLPPVVDVLGIMLGMIMVLVTQSIINRFANSEGE